MALVNCLLSIPQTYHRRMRLVRGLGTCMCRWGSGSRMTVVELGPLTHEGPFSFVVVGQMVSRRDYPSMAMRSRLGALRL